MVNVKNGASHSGALTIIPPLGSLGHQDCKFEMNLGYMGETLSQKKKKKKRNSCFGGAGL
jgi:hypothetical protein